MRRRDEQGAVAALVALMLVVVTTMAAFAVDLGMQRVVRSDMQTLSDVVALDTARLLDGRTAAQVRAGDATHPALEAAKTASVQRNDESNLGSIDEVDVALVFVETGPHGSMVPRRSPSGALVPVADDQVPDGVFVTSGGSVNFAFRPGSGSASRDALAVASAGACFSIGSYAARLKTGDSPLLGPLLGAIDSDLNLSVLDYRALAGVNVSLIDLLGVDLDAGTFQEVLDGSGLLSLSDFYLVVAEALKKESGQTAQVDLLESLSAKVTDLSRLVPLDQVLSLGTGGAAGLEAGLNVLDLVTAATFAADGDNAVNVPRVGISLPPLANVQAALKITEPPQVGCGRKQEASAHSAQVKVDLSANALNLNLGLLDTRVSLTGQVELAAADGRLTDVRCSPDGITVAVTGGLVRVHLALQVKVSAIFGLIPAIDAPIFVDGYTRPEGDAVVNIVDGNYDTPASVGAGNSGIPELHTDTSQLKALGIPLGWLTSHLLDPLVDQVVNPVVNTIDDALLTPVFELLGLQVSGADVYAKPTPVCGNPELRG